MTFCQKKHIKDERDYLIKTLECLAESDEYILAIHQKSWNNICYNKTKEWAVIFNEFGELMTSYKIEPYKKDFETLHREVGGKIEKGVPDETIRETFKRLRDLCKNLDK